MPPFINLGQFMIEFGNLSALEVVCTVIPPEGVKGAIVYDLPVGILNVHVLYNQEGFISTAKLPNSATNPKKTKVMNP